MSRLLLCLLAACDALDGHIDDADHCCEAVTESRVAACLRHHVEPNRCLAADCPLTSVVVCRLPDGGLE